LVGAFEFNRKTSFLLRPSRIVVHLHDVIETQAIGRGDVDSLKQQVWEAVAAPLHAAMVQTADKA
jgi:hypothetical protein